MKKMNNNGYITDDGWFCEVPFRPKEYEIRSKHDERYHYSYSPFIVWGEDIPEQGCVYTDRLFQWDPEKFDKLCLKHFGNVSQYFNDRNHELVEAFLSDYLGKKVKLGMIVEWCNVSSGYPLWSLHYTEIV